MFSETAPHFAENIFAFGAQPIRRTLFGDGSNLRFEQVMMPTLGWRLLSSHSSRQPSAPQTDLTPWSEQNFVEF